MSGDYPAQSEDKGMTFSKPTWNTIWLACKCGRKWDDWQPCMVPVSTWIAHVKTYRCPQCGKSGRNILIRLTALDAAENAS